MGGSDDSFDVMGLAADYAMGLLNPEETRAFEAELATNPALREEVRRAQLHMQTLGIEVDEAGAHPGLMDDLRRELWAENWQPWRRRIRVWEYALGGIAAALVAFWVFQSSVLNTAPASVLHAKLHAEDPSLNVLVALDRGGEILLAERSTVATYSDEQFMLWIESDGRFQRIGLLKSGPISSFRLSRAQKQAFEAGAFLVLSQATANSVQTTPIVPIARAQITR